MKRQSLWDALVRGLAQMRTGLVFGIQNDDLRAVRSLRREGLRLVLARDQRNAMFMTAGYAMASERLGVCIVGKGPALTNTITGLLESASSSAPVLLIATGTEMRCVGTNAFQEADQLALVRPIVKWAYRVEHAGRLLWALERAAFLAVNGNPGPVYLEIPDDLEWDSVFDRTLSHPVVLRTAATAHGAERVIERLLCAERPLLLVGGGANGREHNGCYEGLAESLGAALFVSASGRGAVNEDHPLFCGLAGLYTAKPMRVLWERADVIVVIGCRLEETTTLMLDGMERKPDIVQIDIDINSFSHRYRTMKLLGDAAETVLQLNNNLLHRRPVVSGWTRQIAAARAEALDQKAHLLAECVQSTQLHVADILAAMEAVLPADAVIVQENGLVDMWSYCFPHFTLRCAQRSIVPSEQTTLGFGAAAALGVKLAMPAAMVVAFVGDGAFDMYRADLFSSANHCAPVTYIVLNNCAFGWLQYQAHCSGLDERQFGRPGTVQISHPDIVTFTADDRNHIRDHLVEACRLNMVGKTVIIDVPIRGAVPESRIQDFYGVPTSCPSPDDQHY